MVAIAAAASASVVRRRVTKRCGRAVWSITPTDQPSGSRQMVRQDFPSTFMGMPIRRRRGVAQHPRLARPNPLARLRWRIREGASHKRMSKRLPLPYPPPQAGEGREAVPCAIMRHSGRWAMKDTIRQKLLALADYERFERLALRYTQLLLIAITLFAMVLVTIDLVRDFGLGEDFMDKAVLQDTFGSVLIILILLEFNHSVQLAIKHRTGAVQVRMVVLIAILVIV